MQRINRFSSYLKKRYPFRVNKIPVDAGFTCPNRDGSKAYAGCSYCDNRSFSPATRNPSRSIEEQIEQGMNFYKRNSKPTKFIIYFQAYTNTYAPLEKLKEIYDRTLHYPDVVGIAIGTRPDCVPDDVLDLIQSYTANVDPVSERHGVDVWLEMGLQTIHNKTLESINRQHTYEDFLDALQRSKGRGFEIVTHAIFGLPGETYQDMMQTVKAIATLPIDSIKIHHLYVAKYTAFEKMYQEGKIHVMEFDEWVNLVCDILERLPANMTIQRLCGELSGEYLVAPRWGKTKQELYNAIEIELARRDSWQGKICKVTSNVS